jgi:hypothetical protein
MALGVVGQLARALALGLVGVGIATAAVGGDVRESGGLDVALRGLGSTGAGSWLWWWSPSASPPTGCSAWPTRPPAARSAL